MKLLRRIQWLPLLLAVLLLAALPACGDREDYDGDEMFWTDQEPMDGQDDWDDWDDDWDDDDWDDDAPAREPGPGGLFAARQEPEVTVTPTAAKAVELEQFECMEFSMQIPKGWTVNVGGTGMYYGIRVQDPEQPLNQMFVLLKAEPLLHSQAGKDLYALYVQMGNPMELMAGAPVMESPSTENFFKLFSAYGANTEQYEYTYAGFTFPRFDNFTVTERFAANNPLSTYALGEETLRATFTEDGQEGEGMFAATVVDLITYHVASGWLTGSGNATADIGYYAAYNVMAMTAAKDTFLDWQPVLTQCLGTLEYSQSFVNATIQSGEQRVEDSMAISRMNDARLDSIMSSWESRNTSQDILSQKQSDVTLGYERVYNTDTGEIYRAENGWSDTYAGSQYQLVTDDTMYTQPISGYIG